MTEKSQISILKKPNLKTAEEVIKRAISQNRGLIIIGNCWVEYNGRARSILDSGERVVFIKVDGSVLIHRPTGYKPVNWQPPGCYFRTSMVDGNLIVEAIRRKVQESLKVFLNRVYSLAEIDLVDEGAFYLHVSEKEIQEAILKKPNLIDEDFTPISYEKKVDPGFIDVYGYDGEGRLVVVEIKRNRAGKSAVIQLSKYVEFVKSTADREVRGILVAPQIRKGVQKMLATLDLEYKRMDLKKCAKIIALDKETKIRDFL